MFAVNHNCLLNESQDDWKDIKGHCSGHYNKLQLVKIIDLNINIVCINVGGPKTF